MKIGSMAVEVMIWIYAGGLMIASFIGVVLFLYAARTIRKLSEVAAEAPGAEISEPRDDADGRCQAVTASGDRCPNPVEHGSSYCGLHQEPPRKGS